MFKLRDLLIPMLGPVILTALVTGVISYICGQQASSPVVGEHPTILTELECFAPVQVEDEPGKVGSPAQDLRYEYASEYDKARKEKLKTHTTCEACGLTKEQLAKKGAHLETHHVISVQRIYSEGLDTGLISDPDNLIVLCRGGTCDEDHFHLGHDPDGPKGPKPPSWAVSNPDVRKDARDKLRAKQR